MSSLPVTFANLPTGEQPLSLFDQNFLYLLNLIQASSDIGFQPEVVDASIINVDPTWRGVVINRTVGGASTTINLPTVSSRSGLALVISDWKGNAGDITIIPNVLDTGGIMGLSQAIVQSSAQGIGVAGSITLYPSTELSGWYVG